MSLATVPSGPCWSRLTLVFVALAGLAAGAIVFWNGSPQPAGTIWTISTAPVLLVLVMEVVNSLRRGDLGLDLVAALSMSSALLFGEPLAGNVVALMYAGGQLLEAFAQSRARAEMTALLGRVAHTAMRFAGEKLEEVPISSLAAADRLLIRQGEVLPVDGIVAGPMALLDMSSLTGESLPVAEEPGQEALSGTTSVGPPFELRVTRPAIESTYARIVSLVETAQSAKAPMVRLADRYAIWFLGATVALAGTAGLLSHDPIRALAVLVVATPCPLILAVPVALISGLSRTARIGVLVKSGGMLEAMARVRTAIIDKTGTLTSGKPGVTEIRTVAGMSEDEVLRLAASLDLASGHVVAKALTDEAQTRGLVLHPPTDARERVGTGLEGLVDGQRVVIGGATYVRTTSGAADDPTLWASLPQDVLRVTVAADGKLIGIILLADRVREDAARVITEFRRLGVSRIVLASGDRRDVVHAIASSVGVDESIGELNPDEKLAIVSRERSRGVVMMVGDGVNDAPALAAADVGVALGARGAAASSEAAGVVVLVDALAPLAKAIGVAQRTRRIAGQSVIVGLGLSTVAMVVAAFGYLPPVQGALLQEAIDVAVILNALRALR
jgi:heavy metal translocating P-type ATPase